jgi:hypothetical protein
LRKALPADQDYQTRGDMEAENKNYQKQLDAEPISA